jgi:biopolymer transport protein ExbD
VYNYDEKPDLNITPLVDIMLVLIAILMVTAPVIEYEEPISLPKGSKSKQVSQIKNINIILTKDMIVRVNKNRYKYKDFADSFILFAKDKDRKTPIFIRAEKDLKYKNIVFLLKTVKEAGFFKVSLITDG